MFVATEYTIVFVFPEDHDLWVEWRKTNEISEWNETITTTSAIYIKKTQYWTNAKGAG